MVGQFSDARNFFPIIDTHEDAIKCARNGGYAGFALAALSVLGAAFVYFARSDIATGGQLSQQQAIYNVAGILISIPFILFWAYRVYIGKGWISCVILILFVCLETVLRLVGGKFGFLNILIFVFIVVALINGFRGCRALKRLGPDQASDVPAVFD
jgi:Na+/melibiose symporter-like transporter